tara:strand:+ start:558 stop:1649 length:1092 start_codon:yes stop_codon:yes gene_type:complete
MENQEPMTPEAQVEETSGISFIDDATVEQAQQEQVQEQTPEPQTIEQPATEQPQEQTEPETSGYEENYRVDLQDNPTDELEAEVLNYLSDRLGRELTSFDALTPQEQQERELDERLSVIAEFVEETGRSPQDWFVYQQLNPENMDDTTAIKFQMARDYPDLNVEEIQMLLGSKYKLDPNLHTEDEVKLSQLQLKMDATQARNGINELRQKYQAPEVQQSEEIESPFDDQWYSAMQSETENLDGVEFDLGNGRSFTFGLNDRYRGELVEKNSRLDEFFDPYVQEDGNWDYDKLNVHRAVIDNMESIVQSVYKQGMADGQRGIVNQAANVNASSPNQGAGQPEASPLADQLRNALGLNRGFGSTS